MASLLFFIVGVPAVLQSGNLEIFRYSVGTSEALYERILLISVPAPREALGQPTRFSGSSVRTAGLTEVSTGSTACCLA